MTLALLALILGLGFAFSLVGSSDAGPEPEPEPANATEGDDSLIGSAGNDLIDGLGGNDTIHGMEGDDTLIGGDGDDWLLGGEGDDSLLGGAGNDLIDQGGGINIVDGGSGDDTVTLSDGFEMREIRDENGNLVSLVRSSLHGGDGDETEGDLLDASEMTESLHLYDDGDRAFIALSPRFERGVIIDGFERYALGSGNDVVEYYREDQALEIDTGAGLDAIYLSNAGHTVNAGSGDDYVAIGALDALNSDLFVDGGEGRDTLELASDNVISVVIDETGSGMARDDLGGSFGFESFEVFNIRATADVIDASATGFGVEISTMGEGTILGGSGSDTLSGDVVYGGAGDDLIEGGYAEGGEGDDNMTGVTLLGGEGDDTLNGRFMTGGAGTDHFIARISTSDGLSEDHVPSLITDYENGESITARVSYNTVDSSDPSITYPEPVVTIEEDALANEVRVLVNGQPALVVQGVSSLPAGALDLTVTGSNPWLS